MGKPLITQRRGKGTPTYRAKSHKFKGEITSPKKKGVMEGKVVELIHCAGHSAPLAKIDFKDEKIIIPAPQGIVVNDTIKVNGKEIKSGNILPLKDIPEGKSIFNIESQPGKPSYCSSAGSFARIVAKFPDRIIIKLPSKKQRTLNPECMAIIGVVAGGGKKDKPFVKAGTKYHAMKAKGRLYPRTSGVAMNAVDHPFGSGRGRNVGKPKTPPRNAPPGRNIGLIRARRTGKKK